MSKRKIIIFLSIAVIFWGAIASWALGSKTQGTAVNPNLPAVHSNTYFSNCEFIPYKDNIEKISGTIKGVILPSVIDNPALVGKGIAQMAKSGTKDKLLVVSFADNIGTIPVTDNLGWQTPFGLMENNQSVYDRLMSCQINSDSKKVATSCNIGKLMPLLQYYVPDCQVTPLVIDSSAKDDVVLKYINKIAKEISDDVTVIITSKYSSDHLSMMYMDELTILDVMKDKTPDELYDLMDGNMILAMKMLNSLSGSDSMSLLTIELDDIIKNNSGIILYYGK